MIGIPIGLLYANAFEWAFHKYVLHRLGRRKESFWSFHFHEHHRNVFVNDFRDPDYERSPFSWNAQGKEVLALTVGGLTVLPLFPVAPFFTATLWVSAWNYWRVHRKAHVDTAWGRKHLPWHFDHHMGPNPERNWCVTYPLFDWVTGTRDRHLGTERSAVDAERRARTLAKHKARVGSPSKHTAPG